MSSVKNQKKSSARSKKGSLKVGSKVTEKRLVELYGEDAVNVLTHCGNWLMMQSWASCRQFKILKKLPTPKQFGDLLDRCRYTVAELLEYSLNHIDDAESYGYCPNVDFDNLNLPTDLLKKRVLNFDHSPTGTLAMLAQVISEYAEETKNAWQSLSDDILAEADDIGCFDDEDKAAA